MKQYRCSFCGNTDDITYINHTKNIAYCYECMPKTGTENVFDWVKKENTKQKVRKLRGAKSCSKDTRQAAFLEDELYILLNMDVDSIAQDNIRN